MTAMISVVGIKSLDTDLIDGSTFWKGVVDSESTGIAESLIANNRCGH